MPETPFSWGGVNDGTRTHDFLDHNQVLPPAELHSPHKLSPLYTRWLWFWQG